MPPGSLPVVGDWKRRPTPGEESHLAGRALAETLHVTAMQPHMEGLPAVRLGLGPSPLSPTGETTTKGLLGSLSERKVFSCGGSLLDRAVT